jgi:nucleotide sugar dehydrogenase
MVPSTYSDRRVCIVGLGYVGLTLAIVMAEVGFDVVGVETRADVAEQLGRGEPHFFEPGLKQRLQALVSQERLRIAPRLPRGERFGVYIITVGTPLGDDGKANLKTIERASREVAEHLQDGALIIMRSTVKLGSTRKIVLPILGKSGVSFDLAFCPERTIEGQALVELRTLPQIVGGNTLSANIRAAQLFQFVTPTVVRVADLETAEMIKLIDNTQRDVHFAYANEVARICDRVGISASEVISAGKLGYPRTNLPIPGPVGGPCLGKDTYLLVESLSELGVTPEMAVAARRLNELQAHESVAHILKTTGGFPDFPRQPVVCLMGLAFKGRPATDDLRGTTARLILSALKEAYPNAKWRGFDPVVPQDAIRAFGLDPAPSMAVAFEGTHLAVIANNHPDFAAMPLDALCARMARPGLVYDFWNNFNAAEVALPNGVGYMALGAHGRAVLPGKRA